MSTDSYLCSLTPPISPPRGGSANPSDARETQSDGFGIAHASSAQAIEHAHAPPASASKAASTRGKLSALGNLTPQECVQAVLNHLKRWLPPLTGLPKAIFSGETARKADSTPSLTGNETAAMEMVAPMFQAILADERIPLSIRVWFARLQVPVLRVAIAEPELFAKPLHPARMLIERMGACVMGLHIETLCGSAIADEIRRVVQVIEQYPDAGQRIFQQTHDDFAAFLSRHPTRSDAFSRTTSVAQQVEQQETLVIQCTIELREMLKDIPVRMEIREFLFKVWAGVLALAALRHGPRDEKTVMLRATAADLVSTAGAKLNRTERVRMLQDLPHLLQRLRHGMAQAGLSGETQEAHIRTLGTVLTDAFLSRTRGIAPTQIETMAQRLACLDDVTDSEAPMEEDLPLDAASIELLLGMDTVSIEVVPDIGIRVAQEMLAWADELQIGDWFLLDHNARTRPVQFVWRSDRGQLYLFASRDGCNFLIQAGRLASYIQAGLFLPAEEDPFTVRTLRGILEKLGRAHPRRLLN